MAALYGGIHIGSIGSFGYGVLGVLSGTILSLRRTDSGSRIVRYVHRTRKGVQKRNGTENEQNGRRFKSECPPAYNKRCDPYGNAERRLHIQKALGYISFFV